MTVTVPTTDSDISTCTAGSAPPSETACVIPMSAGECSLVFFDGVCGLCNRLVDFILRRDTCGRIRLAPLQGETASRLLEATDREQVNTIVMLKNGREFRRSAAVVRILWTLGGVWSFLGSLLWVVPLPLRNLGYRIVSSGRYKLFGKRETCRLPTPSELGRLLP